MTIEQTSEQRARVEEFQRKHRIVLLTLLFTDVVGSTKLKQLLGERAAIELTERHHTLLREILARFPDAEEIDTAGDSFFMVFAKPSDAVQFALIAQRGVRELARETGQPVLDRIGIHVGEVFIQDRGSERRNLFGIQIDSTARIMSLGNTDQILLSRFAFDNARLVLRGFEIPGIGELSWLNHGYYELKGVEEPLEVCEVGEAGLAALTPPGNSEKAHRFHAADAEPVLGWRPSAGQLVPETRWKLESPLGQGGFGEVWLAQHETLKQRRVLKFCFKAERARALKREATLFRVLRERFGEHPNIVAIHDVFFDKAPYYLVMDYVDGPSLDRWTGAHANLAETPLEQRFELVAQIADALQAAHDSGIIHRDVKPSNVLIADPASPAPRAKLVDFGIGQVVNAEALAGVTRLGFTQTMLYTGSGSGTPLYQAPELLAGQPATTRSDLYSLGVLLWQIVLGDFTRPLATDWSDQIADPLVREDIRQCVSGDPAKRFAAAAELAVRLRALLERRSALEQDKARRAEIEKRAYRRGIMRAAALGACVVALVAGLAVYALHQARVARVEKQRADEERMGAEAAKQRAEAGERTADVAKQRAEAGERATEAAKRRAVAAKKAADELISFMQYDLRDSLSKLGQLKMMEGINTRVRRYQLEHPPDPEDQEGIDKADRERSVSLDEQAKILNVQGDFSGALDRYRESLAIAERLAKKYPDNSARQRDLAISHNKVGNILEAQDDLSNALVSYREGMAIREKLVKEAPGDAERQRGLSVNYENVGDVLKAQGDLSGALNSYHQSLAIAEKLAQRDQDNAGWQFDLSTSEVRLGNVLQAQGDLPGALKSYRKSVAIREKLVQKDPDNMDWQNSLSFNYSRAGDVLKEQGDLPGALKSYRESLAIREKLVQKDPDNMDWRDNLAISVNKVGDVLKEQRDLPGALKSYRESLDIREKLVQKDPDNMDWQDNLAISARKVGDVLKEQSDLPGALKSYRESLAICEKLTQKDPDNMDWQDNLSLSYSSVGDILSAQGEHGEALKAYRGGLVIVERLAQQDPTNADRQFHLSYSYNNIGWLLQTQQQWKGAADAFSRALESARPWLTHPPAKRDWITKFSFAAGWCWTILRDAPPGTVELDRAAVLRDLRTARDAMVRLKETNGFVPPMNMNLPWIEKLIEAAEKTSNAPARSP